MSVLSCALFFALPGVVAQRLAVITPEKDARTMAYADRVGSSMSSPVRILDTSLTDVAFRSVAIQDPFNMSVPEGRAVSAAVGCDYFLLIRTGASRRSSFARPEYYEAFATLYLVSGRTGNLLLWRLLSFDADDQTKADVALTLSAEGVANELVAKMKTATRAELTTSSVAVIEELPIEGTPAAVDFKPPVPYRRIKPAYTAAAFLYDIRAIVEIESDIGADGSVLSTRPVRWAGYGLDESAETAVRAMNWRPAMRNGKPLPMRVLLRYNFTKVDKE